MATGLLYRGVSLKIHSVNSGLLIPKGTSLSRAIQLDSGLAVTDSGITTDASTENAVIGHQRDSDQFPSSGVSTTPHFERAKFYATRGYTGDGVVYRIARHRLAKNGVTEYVVSAFAISPEVPENDEVILVHRTHGVLPTKIVVDVIDVGPSSQPSA